tara:strand:- start:2550 stop:4568 length:2019 start_codon:yes stop_codon:yes gene_type:complete
MKKLKNILLLIVIMISSTVFSQELSIESNLSGLKLKLGEEFTPDSYAVDRNGEKIMCAGVIYYNKRGVFSKADAITVDREEGKIIANKPGSHEVVALCVSQDGQRLSRTFDVVVEYPKTEEIKIILGGDKIYTGTYVPLNFEVIDEMGYKRDDVLFKLNSSNNVLEVDSYNNVKAIKPGSASIEASYDGISAKIKINVLKNQVSEIEISSNIDVARTGDVVKFKAVGYDSRGREVKNLPFAYSFSGKAIDKTATASGLILDDGRFVAEIIGDYLITTSLGNVSASKRLKVIDRGVAREIIKVGKGVVTDKHTSDFWVFEGLDGRDYAVTGTWGADGTSFFWDVTDPSNLKKIDSVKVDARTVNDVKVSEDGRIAVISREGASNRKNGIIIIDVSNPYDVEIISEYTKNLTGGVHNVFIYDDHVYALSAGQKYYIINIEDPKNPFEVGMFEVGKEGQSIHDVWVEDGIAYSSNWRDGVYLVDVGNGIAGGSPSNPVAFGNYDYPTGAHHATFPFKSKSTGKFYTLLGDEIFPDGVDENNPNITAGFVHFVDFSDLDNPKEVARYELPGQGSHNYWIEDDVLYVAMYGGGVRIVDISGDLIGDLYRQGREIGYIMTGTSNGYIPNATMSWGAQLYKGYVFYSDWNNGLGSSKVSKLKPDTSKQNQYINNIPLID